MDDYIKRLTLGDSDFGGFLSYNCPLQIMSTAPSPNYIEISGAREHNLKGVSLKIPKNQLVVFTGLSGSGKSSLAFDTLYAEGQRRYVESLSSYARQFLGIMKKPEVEHIDGLSPAISIDQKTTSHNPRSTVGTITEIYDYLRLLYAKVGQPNCPNCGQKIAAQSVDQIAQQIIEHIDQQVQQTGLARVMIFAPVIRDKKGEFTALFARLSKQGFGKIRVDKQLYELTESLSLIKTNRHSVDVLIDRVSWSRTQTKSESEVTLLHSRLRQSIEQGLKLADGLVIASLVRDQSLDFPTKPQDYTDLLFSEKLACSTCGISIPDLEPRLFSFNAPQGACPHCSGLGSILKIDQQRILAPELTLSEGAIIPFAQVLGSDSWWARLVKKVVESRGYDFRKTPFNQMDQHTQNILLNGDDKHYVVEGTNREGRMTTIQEKYEGFIKNLERRYSETESDFVRQEIAQYMIKQTCPECNGQRLNPQALAVTIDNLNIAQFTALSIYQNLTWLSKLHNQADVLTPKQQTIAVDILKEITSRLSFLKAVGLNYLTLNREASTLAGGEAQRIRLASQIGTGLSGVLYILDEPTIGLHQRDNDRLIATLKNLRDKGNSVIVVEHDQEVIEAADFVFDFGPEAGKKGGEIVAAGTPDEIKTHPQSLTGKYLSGKKQVTRQKLTQPQLVDEDTEQHSPGSIRIFGASHHNLKHIDVDFPLGKLICITGVSGSGKSSLLHDTLFQNLVQQLGLKPDEKPGAVESISVPESITKAYLIDQKPIGKTPRSNPATYSKAFDQIRQLFAYSQEARVRGFTPSRFSFNTKGGRCEACKGDGQIKIEMQFLADVYVTCDVCNGKRYNQETLAVEYKGKSIDQVLQMTIDEALEFFQHSSLLSRKLGTLKEVGLGYLQLGQPAPTLSGGEAQRLKLARELSHQTPTHHVYLLDEPTTGLHFADVQKLLNVLDQLVKQNNTVIVIEHNLDIICNADWIIDLGPEGGDGGGEVVYTGTPAALINCTDSITGKYLAKN